MTRTGKIVLIGSLAAVGLVVLVCGGLGFLAYTAMRDFPKVTARSDAFLDQLAQGQVRAAYDSTTAGFRASTPFDKFQAVVDRYPVLTKASTRTPSGMRMYANNGQAQAIIQYTLVNPNNSLSFSITLISEGGRWTVHGLNFP